MINYNYACYLKDSIQAVLNQTRKPDEFIIIDDGSTDESVEIIREMIKDSPYASIIINKKNIGIAKTHNLGIQLSTSDFIFLAASDDMISSNFVYENMRFVENDSRIKMCCSIPSFFDHEKKWSDDLRIRQQNVFNPQETLKLLAKKYFWIAGHTAIISAEFLKNHIVNDYLKQYSDWYLIHILGLSENIGYIPQSLSYMRIHSKSYGRDKRKYSEYKIIFQNLFSEILKESDKVIKNIKKSSLLSALDNKIIFFLFTNKKYIFFLPSVLRGKIRKFFNRIKNLKKKFKQILSVIYNK